MRMKNRLKSSSLAAGFTIAAAALAGCATALSDEPYVGWTTSPLDAHPISVELNTEVLRVALPAENGSMRNVDIANVQGFVSDYEKRGEGPLVLSLPTGAANTQLAIKSAADVRDIAFSRGVDYGTISMRTYDAAGMAAPPIVLAFDTYEAVAPDCNLLSRVDLSDISTNSEHEAFGCAVRTSFAAMLAEPADLLGDRELSAPNNALAVSKYGKYQRGEATSSAVTAAAGVEE